MRQQLLSHLPWFVSAVTKLAGIRRIALLGSITSHKQNPKDIDFLVVVDDDVDLEPLARLGRKIKGRAHEARIFFSRMLKAGTSVEHVRGRRVGRAYADRVMH